MKLNYNSRVNPVIRLNGTLDAILVRQDGQQKHGRPVQLSLKDASRTALSSITTAEFPHLYALREALSNFRSLEINPRAARSANDRFEDRTLKPDASNLAAVLAHLKEKTATALRPGGVLPDIAANSPRLFHQYVVWKFSTIPINASFPSVSISVATSYLAPGSYPMARGAYWRC